MRLPVLVAFLLVSGIAVAAWSVATGAGWFAVVIRVAITLFAVQAAYFLLVLAFGFGTRGKPADEGKATLRRSEAPRLDEAP